MTSRELVLVTHRWLGLSSSVVLAIVGLTGAGLIWPSASLLRRISGRLHEELGLGGLGFWLVVWATVAAVLLELGGVVLWWKRKALAVQTRSGWWRALADFHHPAGVILAPLMLILSVTGVGMAFVTPDNYPNLRDVIFRLHTTRDYSTFVKLLYLLGTLGFMVQGVTGVVMWWRRRRRR